MTNNETIKPDNSALNELLEKYKANNLPVQKVVQNTLPDSFGYSPKMSHFKNPVKNTIPHSEINIQEFHKRITTDKLTKKICEELKSLGKESQRAIKATKLEYITPSGSYTKRSNNCLINHSGYLCIDFDNLPECDLDQLKTKLIGDKLIETVLLFKSPSGNGLKWFIQIPESADTHGKYFDAVKNYVQNTYQLEIDKACRDVSRACFLSYDESAYLNPNLDIKRLDNTFLVRWSLMDAKTNTSVPKLKAPALVEPKIDQKTETILEYNNKLEKVNNLVKQLLASEIDITSGYANWIKIGFSLCELGEDGRNPFHQISSLNEEYDFEVTEAKYSSMLNDYDGSIKLGTLFFLAKPFLGVDISPVDASTITFTIGNDIPRTAKQRLKDAEEQPEIKMLLGNIWMTGELHVLFADTGSGKSVWATQVADSLSKGKKVFNVLANENKPLRVLYYDFELSDKQFQKRYSEGNGKRYEFTDNLFVDNIDFQKLIKDNPKEPIDGLIIKKIKEDILKLKVDVLVIDNLTYLRTESTQDTSVALNLVRELNELKKEFGISILVLAHTPKVKEGTPLTLNELGGSKHLSNFVDSVSAIGKSSKGADIRYIKQTKASRSGEMVFDSANVIVIEMKHEDRFLGFHYLDCEYESDHLQNRGEENRFSKQEKNELIMQLYGEGLSVRAIEERTGYSKSSVGRIVKQQ